MKKAKQFMLNDKPFSDHDIIITLVETVKNNQTTVVERINDVKNKVQEVNDGINAKVTDHEIRLKRIEYVLDSTSPVENTKNLANLLTWQKQIEFKIKFILAFVFVAGGVFEWIISEGVRILFHSN